MIPVVSTKLELSASPRPEDVDHRVLLHALTWDQYEATLAMRGDRSAPRIAYLDGELEIMSPSIHHERRKKLLARLVEAYAEEQGLALNAYGSWTLKDRTADAAAEPDECYVLGTHVPDRPDLAIEVVWTSGGLPKLEIYRRLRVREVWIYEDARLRFFRLRGERYREVPRSVLLPELDATLLASFVEERDQTAAVRAYRAALRVPRG